MLVLFQVIKIQTQIFIFPLPNGWLTFKSPRLNSKYHIHISGSNGEKLDNVRDWGIFSTLYMELSSPQEQNNEAAIS